MASSSESVADPSPSNPPSPRLSAKRMSWKRRILFAAVPIVFIYVLAEIVITSLFLFSEPVGSMQINEEIRSPLYQYDPVIGSRLSPKKFRTAILRPNGAVESTATIQGNNLGFPDASDFLPKKPAGVGAGTPYSAVHTSRACT